MSAQEIEDLVRGEGLVERASPLIVLLSGGADSLCLLDVTTRILSPENIVALHINYGLRDESMADERFCRDICRKLDVAIEVRQPRRPTSGNLQSWARDQRYGEAALLAFKFSSRAALIATGHTASDQVETLLYRLATSPGRRALLAMKRRDGQLVRPLLGVARESTENYCRERGLVWRNDQSNATLAFARNRIRHEVIPALREIHPAVEDNILDTLALLRDEAYVLDAVVQATLNELSDPPEVSELFALPAGLARLIVQYLAEQVGGDSTGSLNRHFDALAKLGRKGGTASLDVGGGLRAVVEYGRLRFEHGQPLIHSTDTAAYDLNVPGRTAFAGGEIECIRGSDLPLADGTIDADTLTGAVRVRHWRSGDRMRPYGLGGSKAVSDLFTDRKIARGTRHRLPLVVCGEEIVWIPGVATGEQFTVTDKTRDRLRIIWNADISAS